MSSEVSRSKSLRDLDSINLSKSFPVRPLGRPGNKKQSRLSYSGGRKQSMPWSLLPRRGSNGGSGATNITTASSSSSSSSSSNNKINSEFPQTPKKSKSTTSSKTFISPAHGRPSRGNSRTGTASHSPTPARRNRNHCANNSKINPTHHNSTEPRVYAHGTASDGGGAAVVAYAKDGDVFLTVGAASKPLQFALAPASFSGGDEIDQKKCVTEEGEAKGAVIHELLPRAGAERVDVLVQKLVKQGDVLAEVNGQDVRDASFSKILALFGASEPRHSAKKKNTNDAVEPTVQSHNDHAATVATGTGSATSSTTTSTTSSPRSSVGGPFNAPPSPAERPRDTREFREPVVEPRVPGAGGRRASSLRNFQAPAFANNFSAPLGVSDSNNNNNNTRLRMRARLGLGGTAANSLSNSCPPSPSPGAASLSFTPRSSKLNWARLPPWGKGWGGGTPGKSPRLGWGGAGWGTPGRSRSSTPARHRSSTFSGLAVSESATATGDADESIPLAPPSPGGDCFPEISGPVGVIAPPSPGGDCLSDETGPVREAGMVVGSVKVSAAPMTTLRLSAREDVTSGNKKKNRVGFALNQQESVAEEAEKKGFIRDKARKPGLDWLPDAPPGSDERGHSTNVDSTERRRSSTGGMGGSHDNAPVKVMSEAERQKLSEAAARELAQYLKADDRGWPWAGREVIWADYVTLNGHHRWVRSEGCRHAFLMVSDALYLLELPTDAVTRATQESRRSRRKAPAAAGSARGAAGFRNVVPFQPLGGRGWYLKVNASMLKFLTVPLSTDELMDTKENADAIGDDGGNNEMFKARSKTSISLAKNGGKVVKIAGKGVNVTVKEVKSGDGRFRGPLRPGLILHGRGWACAWLECASVGERDSLVEVMKAWHTAVTQGAALKVDRLPHAEASEKAKGGNGATMISMLMDRKTCAW